MQHNFPTPRKIFHFWGTFSHELLRAQNRHFQQPVSISPFHNPKHRQDHAAAHTVRSREVGSCLRDYKIGLLQLVAFRFTQVPNQATSTGPNHAARVVTITPKYDHISHILEKLHWLPVEQRITYKICLLTYKSLNNMGPIYLKDLLHPILTWTLWSALRGQISTSGA